MAINLKEHAIFIDRLQMEMVPLSIAQKAVEEVIVDTESKVEQAMEMIEKSLTEINKSVQGND